jgi:hypothetical protein
MKYLLLNLWIFMFFPSSLYGQDEAASLDSTAKGRVAWFVYTSMPAGLENPVSIMSGEAISQLTLCKRSPSDPVKIPSDGIFKLVRKIENPEQPEKPKYQILAQAFVPEEVNKALVVLIPAAKNASGVIFQPRVIDLKNFKGGGSMYLNMTNVQVGVKLGDANILIKPGEDKVQNFSQLSEPTNMAVCYSYFHPEKQEWKVLSASTIAVYPTRREICIFSWDPQFNRIDYHGITFPVME